MGGGESRELLLAAGKMLLSPVTRAVSFKVRQGLSILPLPKKRQVVKPAVLARMADPGSQRGKAWNCLTVYLECKRSTGVHDSDPVTKTERAG